MPKIIAYDILSILLSHDLQNMSDRLKNIVKKGLNKIDIAPQLLNSLKEQTYDHGVLSAVNMALDVKIEDNSDGDAVLHYP